MKKSVLAAALVGVMLLSGCSGVSQDEYNSLLEENSKLKEENNSLQSQNDSLNIDNMANSKVMDKISQENSSLKDEILDLQEQLNSNSETTSNNPTDEKNASFIYNVFTNSAEEEFVITDTGNKWYRENSVYVSYIEENNYLQQSDEELIVYAYYDMLKCVTEHPSNFNFFNVYIIAKKDGTYIAYGFLTITGEAPNREVTPLLTWYGDFSRLNTNPEHIEIFGQ